MFVQIFHFNLCNMPDITAVISNQNMVYSLPIVPKSIDKAKKTLNWNSQLLSKKTHPLRRGHKK